MKKITLFLFAALAVCLVAFYHPTRSIVGHWTVTYHSGDKMTIDFRSNGTAVAHIVSQNFTVGGQYKLNGDILSITDTSCGKNYWGKYKGTFFSNDSVFCAAIEDSCSGRKGAIDQQTMVRDKAK